MPNYDFECCKCGWKESRMLPITSPKMSRCPNCEEQTLVRLVGSGAGFHMKSDADAGRVKYYPFGKDSTGSS